MTKRITNQSLFPVSCYTDLQQYHALEEEHAFYIDMQKNMLGIIQAYIQEVGQPIKALELGAGTGLLTKKLKTLNRIKLDILEPDKRSIDILMDQFKGSSTLLITKKAEEMGFQDKYKIIISSFSHDHVQRGDLLSRSICKALKKGGIYICGMEVLRAYRNETERIAALHAWHRYVIREARKRGLGQLAVLEQEALESGIHKIADFKRDENRFEKEMSSAGLHLIQKIKIGPFLKPKIGGVFVYVYQK